MLIKYCLTSKRNPLYKGKFSSHERYKTFGQHSFIVDFVSCARRNKCAVELLIEGKESFPLYEYMLDLCEIVELKYAVDTLKEADIVIIDKLSREAMEMIDPDPLKFYMVHDAGERIFAKLVDICDKVICMTETAVKFQSQYITAGKIMLCHQGVDLARFSAVRPDRSRNAGAQRIKVLLFTRLARQKRATIISVLNELLNYPEKYDITMLGDGDYFWEINNTYGNRITVINHIPCNSIQTFLPDFDIIISSARGVMEACASGIPAICAGFGYAGLVSDENIPALMIRNLTGYGESADLLNIHREIEDALLMDKSYWRSLSEKYFDMDNLIKNILREKYDRNIVSIPL